MLAPVGVVGEIEDVLPRGGQVGADGDPRCLGDSLASAVFSHHTGEASSGVQREDELPRRAHRTDRVGTRRADTDREEIKNADSHLPTRLLDRDQPVAPSLWLTGRAADPVAASAGRATHA